jgi:hypothetical protein
MKLQVDHLLQEAAEMAAVAAGHPDPSAMIEALIRTHYDDLPAMVKGSPRVGHGGYAQVFALPRNMGVMKVCG